MLLAAAGAALCFQLLLILSVVPAPAGAVNLRGEDFYFSGDPNDLLLMKAALKPEYDGLARDDDEAASVHFYGRRNAFNDVKSVDMIVLERPIDDGGDDDETHDSYIVKVDADNRPSLFYTTRDDFMMKFTYLDENDPDVLLIDIERDGKKYQVEVDLDEIASGRKARAMRRTRRDRTRMLRESGVIERRAGSTAVDQQQRLRHSQREEEEEGRRLVVRQVTRRVEMNLTGCDGMFYPDAFVKMKYETRRTRGNVRREGTTYGMVVKTTGSEAGYYEFSVPVRTQGEIAVVEDACIPAVAEIEETCNGIEFTLSGGINTRSKRRLICNEIITNLDLSGTREGSRISNSCQNMLEETFYSCQVVRPVRSQQVPDLEEDICADLALPGNFSPNRWSLMPVVLHPANLWTGFEEIGEERVPDERDVFVYPTEGTSAVPTILSLTTDPPDPEPMEGYTLRAVVSCVGNYSNDTEDDSDSDNSDSSPMIHHRVRLTWHGSDGFRGSTFCRVPGEDDDDGDASSTTIVSGTTIECETEVAGAKSGTNDVCSVVVTPENITESITVEH